MGEYGTPENPYIVAIPGWDDVVKIHPKLRAWDDPEIARKDWATYKGYMKAGDIEGAEKALGKSKFLEINRRAERIKALKASPTPEIAKSIGKIMTYIDDTEDLLSTGLVIGRALLKRSPWLAAKVGARFIPGLGWALLAVDVLEIGTFMWKLLPWGRKGKRKGFDILNPTNWRKAGRAARAHKFMAGKPGVGAALEALQSSEMLFGTGIQIGPLVGAVQDGIFGAIKQAGGKTVTIQQAPESSQMADLERVGRGLSSAANYMMQVPQMYQDTHIIALTAFGIGIQNVQEIVNNEEMIDRSDEVIGYAVPHVLPWEPMTREILAENGINPDTPEPHVMPGSPMDISYGELCEWYTENGKACIENYANITGTGTDAVFASSTLREIIIGCYNCDLPAEEILIEDMKWENTTEDQFTLETLETGIRPPKKENYVPQKYAGGCLKPIKFWTGTLLPPVIGKGLKYEDELNACIADYKTYQDTLGKYKIGTQNLKRIIYCHFGKWMPLEDIPTSDPF